GHLHTEHVAARGDGGRYIRNSVQRIRYRPVRRRGGDCLAPHSATDADSKSSCGEASATSHRECNNVYFKNRLPMATSAERLPALADSFLHIQQVATRGRHQKNARRARCAASRRK